MAVRFAPPDTPGRLPVGRAAVSAGALTMVGLCFANGLQAGGIQTFAQATEALKHTFHVNDAALGFVPFCTGITGNVGAIPIAALCNRFPRTRVLGWMFAIWGGLMAVTALVPGSGLVGFAAGGFVLFALVRVAASMTEATDPASYPLIADYWPVDRRSSKVGIFNAGAAVGAFLGLIGSGLIIDHVGWRWAFAAWLPLGLLGAALILTRPEPGRGCQDAAYGEELEHLVELDHDPEADLVRRLVEEGTLAAPPELEVPLPAPEDGWSTVRTIARLRTWRLAAVGVAVATIMQNGLQFWGIAYFKRTFHLDGTHAAALAPVLGIGTFAGILGGGFIADRLLRRGVVRARIWVTGFGYVAGGACLVAAFSTTRLALGAPVLGVGAALVALPTGPQFAVLMDVTPAWLRSQASAAANVLMAGGAFGSVAVGLLSTAFGENLRLALLCMAPAYALGGLLVLAARRTYVADVAMVVAEARSDVAAC